MVLLLAFGLMDLWTSVYLVLLHAGVLSFPVAFFHSFYLFVKGVFFWGDLYSFLDILASIYILLVAIGVHSIFLTIIIALYLLQKAYFSFASVRT